MTSTESILLAAPDIHSNETPTRPVALMSLGRKLTFADVPNCATAARADAGPASSGIARTLCHPNLFWMAGDKDNEKEGEGLRAAVDMGADIVGAAAGGALGVLFAGPVGAAGAGIAGVAITRSIVAVGEQICDRLLAPREKARVGAAIAVSTVRTQERLANGDRARDDGFINDGTDRPPIDEVTEGLLLAAQRAYDEKKVPYIGRLSANLNFRPDLNVQAAAFLVRIADQLSYQQLCLLRLAHENEFGDPLVDGKAEGRVKNPAHGALLSDLLELERLGFINNGGTAVLGLSDIDPPKARLQLFGRHIFDLMELKEIPNEDLQPLRRIFDLPAVIYGPIGSVGSPLTGREVIVRRGLITADHGHTDDGTTGVTDGRGAMD